MYTWAIEVDDIGLRDYIFMSGRVKVLEKSVKAKIIEEDVESLIIFVEFDWKGESVRGYSLKVNYECLEEEGGKKKSSDQTL